jgi:hypothetical protein
MTDAGTIKKLLRILVAAVENLDEEELRQLLSGKTRIAFVPVRRMKDGASRLTAADQAELLAKLNEAKERSEARQILSVIVNRDSLEALARTLKVHVVKHDRREEIESKIIEFVIGGKLRTEAIRSLNLKGGSTSIRRESEEN